MATSESRPIDNLLSLKKSKLMSAFHVPVLLLTLNFIIAMSKQSADPLSNRLVDPQLLRQYYVEIHDQ